MRPSFRRMRGSQMNGPENGPTGGPENGPEAQPPQEGRGSGEPSPVEREIRYVANKLAAMQGDESLRGGGAYRDMMERYRTLKSMYERGETELGADYEISMDEAMERQMNPEYMNIRNQIGQRINHLAEKHGSLEAARRENQDYFDYVDDLMYANKVLTHPYARPEELNFAERNLRTSDRPNSTDISRAPANRIISESRMERYR